MSAPSSKMRTSSASVSDASAGRAWSTSAAISTACPTPPRAVSLRYTRQDRPERSQWQRPQRCPLLGESFVDDMPYGGVNPRVCDRVQPVTQLGVQVFEIAKGPGQEEVLANVAERPLDPAFRFGAVRPTRLGMKTIVAGKIDESTVVDDATGIALTDHSRGGHTVLRSKLKLGINTWTEWRSLVARTRGEKDRPFAATFDTALAPQPRRRKGSFLIASLL